MWNERISQNIPDIPVRIGEIEVRKTEGEIIGLHFHDEIELLAVLEGEFGCVVDNKEYIAKKGQVIFINSRVPHSTFCKKANTTYALVQFKLSDFIDTEVNKILKYSIRLSYSNDEVVCVIDDEKMCDTVVQMAKEFAEKNTAYSIMIKSGIYSLLASLYRNGVISDSYNYAGKEIKKLLPALEYINEHYYEDISLDFISSSINFEKSYFCRSFKKAIGATFTEYINFVRICKSEKLLRNTDESISEIATKVGYSSVSYFNREFKHYKSCSPKVYRTARYGTM